MGTGNTDLTDFGKQMESERRGACVRAILVRTTAGWELYYMSAIVGAEPPEWAETTWLYESIAFVACTIPASELSKVCTPSSDTFITFGHLSAAVPKVIGPVNWTRQPSYIRHSRAQLTVPVTDFRIAVAERSAPGLPHDMLVGANAPSFPEPKSAWRAFSEGDFSLSGAQDPPSELALIRVAKDDAWIGHVHVTATSLEVEIQGTSVTGSELELFSTSRRETRTLTGPGVAIFALDRGLPGSAWLWLKCGTRWLDYRSIDPTSSWSGDLTNARVEIETPIEPQANIEALIASGEGPRLEFKEKLPTNSKERRMLKTVPAFATGDGGSMIFGVNRDEMTITGLGDDEPTKLRDQLITLIHSAVTPMPQVSTSCYRVDGGLILVLDVYPGQSPPYGLITDPGSRDKPEYYVRRGANTYPAQPSELREAILGRVPPQGHPTPFSPW